MLFSGVYPVHRINDLTGYRLVPSTRVHRRGSLAGSLRSRLFRYFCHTGSFADLHQWTGHDDGNSAETSLPIYVVNAPKRGLTTGTSPQTTRKRRTNEDKLK